MDISAIIKSEVELGAILDFEPFHTQVGAHEEPYGLHYKILNSVHTVVLC